MLEVEAREVVHLVSRTWQASEECHPALVWALQRKEEVVVAAEEVPPFHLDRCDSLIPFYNSEARI